MNRAGRKRKYCSTECERLFRRKSPVFESCLFCGADLPKVLKAGQPRRYCNRKCAQSLRIQNEQESRDRNVTCAVCGVDFLCVTLRQKYCSDDCRLERNRQLASARWEAMKAARPETKSWVCEWCGGDVIVPISFTGHGKFHDECRLQARRAHNRRKTLKRQGFVSRKTITHEEVAERDEFVCYLCGDPVDMSLPRNDKWGATLDHVVPISRGGEDSLDNLRLAHWHCNVRKSNKFLEELNV